MAAEPEVFLDTCAPFVAVQSEPDAARLILELSEAGAISLWVGPWVLR